MQSVLNKIQFFLCALVILLVTLGGTVFVVGKAKIEVGVVDPWVAMLLVITAIYFKLYKSAPSYLTSLETYSEKLNYKKIGLFFAASFFIAHTFKYLSFNVSGMDQAYVHQSLLNAFETPILRCDVCKYGTYMGEHTSPMLIIVSPLMSIFKSHIAVYFFEVVIIFFSLHLLISTILKDKKYLWALSLLIILAHKSLKQSMIWDFREDHLTFLFISLTLVAALRGKVLWFVFSFIATLMTKEHLPYFLPFLSFPLLFEKELKLSKTQRIILSVFVVISSVIWLILIQKYITPYFNGGAPPTNHIVNRFPGFGATNIEVVKNLLFVPKYWIKLLTERVLTIEGLKYAIFFFGPFIIFIWRKWWWFIAISPIFAMNLLSYTDTQRSMSFHYDLPVLPLLIVALLLQVRKVKSPRKLIIPLLIALCFSGRWPNFYSFKYFPSIENLNDQSFFRDLDDEKIYATNFRHSAQIAHHKMLKIFRFNSEFSSFEEFLLESSKGSEDNPAFNVQNINYLILDLSYAKEASLKKLAVNSGWSIVKTSESSRFELLEKL